MLSQCVQSFSSHCWLAFSCVFDACMCREVGLKPCASCESLQITWTTDNQTYIMCLVSNRPATSSSTLGIITQSRWSQLSFQLGSVRSTYSDTIELAQTVQRCALKQKKPVQFLESAHEAQAQPLTSFSTNGKFHHEKPSQFQKRLFAINMHCKKQELTCILYFAPLFLLLC